ncbi:MAG: LamG domain-containing protein [Planctomycetota bacterium]
MKWLNCAKIRLVLIGFVAGLVICGQSASATNINQAPIADAGLSRYAAYDPIVLDGTGSYDADNSGPLTYAWRQIAGPSVVIADANTATPTVSGFIQTDAIQECEFELIVSDGELTSPPDTVKVIIVSTFGASTFRQENPPFDPDKPTVIFFGGGNCVTGGGSWQSTAWAEKANIISFTNYEPDHRGGSRTYYRCGDMIIVYLSGVAPDYKQPIQAIGFSTGGDPAMDVGIHLNLTYADARYAVNRVTFVDAACRVESEYASLIQQFLASSVDGEQSWVDAHQTGKTINEWVKFLLNALTVLYPSISHAGIEDLYKASLTNTDMNKFNNGVVGGAYWSVVGPGKNLQLASTPGTMTYAFEWHGGETSGYMYLLDETRHPGRLPEPVTLVGPVDVGDPNGVVLTCEESENAVGYQLLFGSDSYRVMDYTIISDTPTPPDEIITTLPFEKTWWTVRVRDEYGSTIYADPKPISILNFSFPVENIGTGKRYGYIQDAINDVVFGDEIVLREGTYYENIDFKGKNITLRSTDPNDPTVVAATVINGGDRGTVVTVSGTEETDCVLAGLTILGGTVGVSCRAGSVTIRNCTIESNGPIAIECWYGYEPIMIDCTILGQVKELNDPRLVAHWKLDETEGSIAADSVGENDGTLYGEPVWQPTGGAVYGALEFDGIDDYVSTPFILNPAGGPFSIFAWVKGGAPGQAAISQAPALGRSGTNWLLADAQAGALMTDLKGSGRTGALLSQTVVTDDDWHRIGLVWDGSDRILYVDDVEVAKDTQSGLPASLGGLHIGTGNALDPSSFWFGLIDDVRIYDRAITP